MRQYSRWSRVRVSQASQARRGRTVATEKTVILHNIKHAAHLAEDEHARALLLHRLEEFVEDEHLAGVVD
jgi:hypothetical protein